jgi:hypothetical protein
MNKSKIIELLKDGAYLDSTNKRFYHPSFIRKGWRTMSFFDISFSAARTALNGTDYEIEDNNGIWKSKVTY